MDDVAYKAGTFKKEWKTHFVVGKLYRQLDPEARPGAPPRKGLGCVMNQLYNCNGAVFMFLGYKPRERLAFLLEDKVLYFKLWSYSNDPKEYWERVP